jgi:hypothetical protein
MARKKGFPKGHCSRATFNGTEYLNASKLGQKNVTSGCDRNPNILNSFPAPNPKLRGWLVRYSAPGSWLCHRFNGFLKILVEMNMLLNLCRLTVGQVPDTILVAHGKEAHAVSLLKLNLC